MWHRELHWYAILTYSPLQAKAQFPTLLTLPVEEHAPIVALSIPKTANTMLLHYR